MSVNAWKIILLRIRFSASTLGLVIILSKLLCIRAMPPMKSMKTAAAKKAAAKPAAKPAAKSAGKAPTEVQAAQKRMAADIGRKKAKALKPGASKEDKETAAAAEAMEQKYKSLRGGEKADFAQEFEKHGINPQKMAWMASYGKDEANVTETSNDVSKGMMTRYLY